MKNVLLGVILYAILVAVQDSTAASVQHHKYCVIGAGPGGLQVAYFLQKNKRDYIVFEKGDGAGTFFRHYPRHDTLISVNKRNTGLTNSEFNLRHDWNSLISDDPDLVLGKYTRVLFPHKKYLVKYLEDYQKKLGIKTQFNTTISNIRKVGGEFLMNDQNGADYSCQVVVMATGIALPNDDHFGGREHTVSYEDMSMNPEDYEGKRVLILGKGNTAFETATHIYGATGVIHMMSRSRLRLAWETHYVGDLRAVNNGLLDTYQLKTLDGLFEGDILSSKIVKNPEGELLLLDKGESGSMNARQNNGGYIYDVIIRCMGWRFDFNIFNKTSIPEATLRLKGRVKKYPKISGDYQFAETKDMYVAGTAGHSLDWRKSAGGFIHGFRYTARTLFRILNQRYEKEPWTKEWHPISGLVDHFTRRVNEGSGNYQMFCVLSDVAIISADRQSYAFIEEYPTLELHNLAKNTGIKVDGDVFVFVFEYGRNFSGPGKDPFREDRASSSIASGFDSNFLHPVYYHFEKLPNEAAMKTMRPKDCLPRPDRLHHTIEDFHTNFRNRRNHVLPVQRFVEHALGIDLSAHSAENCLRLALTSTNLPAGCSPGQRGTLVSTRFHLNSQ